MLAAVIFAGSLYVQDPPKNPAPPAPATTTQGQPQQPQPAPGPLEGMGGLLIPIALCFVIIYFMMIRPQKRQMKEREALLAGVKKNDEVVTTSGLVGTVSKVKEQKIELIIDSKKDVRVWMLKSAIMNVIPSKTEDDDEEEEKKEGAKESEGSKQG